MATAISDEARAKYHEFVRRGKRNIYQGLTFWTPNINLFRDPRWGRGMETYGEDPYLTGRMAVKFIHGLQGDDPKYLKTVATAKHYAVHSGPESLRHTFDAAHQRARPVRDLPAAFRSRRSERAARSRVMCAYNSVDGLPACANPRLLDDILRKQWGFQGYVVSDCGAIGDIYLNHKSSPNAPAGVAARDQSRHRPQLRRGVRQPAAGGQSRPASRNRTSIQPLRRLLHSALQARHVRSAVTW